VKPKPIERLRAAAEIAAMQVIATAAVIIIVAVEGIAGIRREAEAVTVFRARPGVSSTQKIDIWVMVLCEVMAMVMVPCGVGFAWMVPSHGIGR
jgi:hypothetical protein